MPSSRARLDAVPKARPQPSARRRPSSDSDSSDSEDDSEDDRRRRKRRKEKDAGLSSAARNEIWRIMGRNRDADVARGMDVNSDDSDMEVSGAQLLAEERKA